MDPFKVMEKKYYLPTLYALFVIDSHFGGGGSLW